jgi:molecular chaperone GrpE (heat shock protein)
VILDSLPNTAYCNNILEQENIYMALEIEYNFYKKNMLAIREKYVGKRVVIVGEEIIASYDNFDDAYIETAKSYEPETFMIYPVPINIEDEIITLSPFGI